MKWFLMPRSYRWSFVFFLLGAMLASFEILLIENIPFSMASYWIVRRSFPYFTVMLVGAFAAAGFLYFGFTRLRYSLLWIGAFLLALWNGFNFARLIQAPSFWFAIYSLFVVAYSLLIRSFWLRQWARSFVDPKLYWFQGAPRAIPQLECDWFVDATEQTSEFTVAAKLCRFDRDGAVIYFDNEDEWKLLVRQKTIRMTVRFRSVQVPCTALLACVLPHINGVGVYLRKNHPDVRKELGDLYEQLKGGGYLEPLQVS